MDDAMDQNPTVVERALQLAKSGRCRSVSDIQDALIKEGYPTHPLEGAALARQLRGMIEETASGMAT
jgi:hypothetical protein